MAELDSKVESTNKECDVEMSEKIQDNDEEEMEEGEASESDDDIEVSVTIGVEDNSKLKKGILEYGPPIALPEMKLPRPPGRSTPPYYGPDTDTYLSNVLPHRPATLEDQRAMAERAKRFGSEVVIDKPAITPHAVKLLYKSLGVDHSDFIGGWWRSDTLFLWTSESLDSVAVKQYFRGYAPISVVWLSSRECIVYWNDSNGPIHALLGLTCPIVYSAGQEGGSVPPRPPTRRHVTPPPQADPADNPAVIERKFKKKGKKKKKKRRSEDSSSDSSDSSSSDSDSDDSSSSSSSDSDSSSSDSDSSDSDTSSDSSSSSDDSDSSDSEDEKKKKARKSKKKAKAAKKTAAAAAAAVELKMELAAKPEVKVEMAAVASTSAKIQLPEEVDGALPCEVPVSELPRGRWRLGVPCPNTKAVLLRFAHAEDLQKAQQIQRRQDIGVAPRQEWRGGASYHDKDGVTRKRRKDMEDSEMEDRRRHKIERRKRDEKWGKSRLSGSNTEPDKLNLLPNMGPAAYRAGPYLPFLPPGVERSYKDLDSPTDSKNPWKGLAMSWGKKETIPSMDYQQMLYHHHNYQSKFPTKERPSSGEEEERRRHRHEDRHYRPQHRTPRRAPPDSDGDDRRRPDDDASSDGSDDVEWSTKMTLPRMKMYADIEEKRRKVMSKSRHSSSRRPSSAVQFASPRKGDIFSRLGGGRPGNNYNNNNNRVDDRSFELSRNSKRLRRDDDDYGSGFRNSGRNVRGRVWTPGSRRN